MSEAVKMANEREKKWDLLGISRPYIWGLI